MDEREFPTTESVRWGWDTFWANFAFLVGVFLAIFVIQGIIELIPYLMFDENPMAEFLTSIVSALVGGVLEMGVIAIMLKFYDGLRPEFNDLFAYVSRVFNYIIASLIYGIMVVIGLVLLIVPGIYIACRFYFYAYFIVEENCGPIEAISRAGEITQGRILQIFLWGLLIFGLNILGLMALGVGILITCPISLLAAAYLYRHLKPAEGVEPFEADPGPPTAPQEV